MPHRGKRLRYYRDAWGWTTRHVEEVSRKLAAIWDDPEYMISSGYVSRIENGDVRLSCVSFGKIEGLVEIYNTGPKAWGELRPERKVSLVEDLLDGPAYTQPIRGGRLAEKSSILLRTAYSDRSQPEMTELRPFTSKDSLDEVHPFGDRRRYLRAVLGQKDTCLRPILSPGTMLIVDRKWTSIPTYDFFVEDDRPMFLIETHVGIFCCWCDSLDNGRTIKVAPHPLSPLPHRKLHEPLKVDRDVDIIGEVVFWGMESRRHQRRRVT